MKRCAEVKVELKPHYLLIRGFIFLCVQLSRNITKYFLFIIIHIFSTHFTINLYYCDMVKHELRVTNYELRVESLNAQDDSLKARVKIQKCEFKSTSFEFKSTSNEFKYRSYESKFTSYEFKFTSYVRVQIHG